jgi:hypothetical protein
MILGREIDKLSSSRQLEEANRDQYFQQDVVELKESMEYWKRKAAEQADLLEAALRQRAATDAQRAAGATVKAETGIANPATGACGAWRCRRSGVGWPGRVRKPPAPSR